MSTTAIQSPDPTEGSPPRRKRWIPVSLRMFVGILLLAAVVDLLWIGIPAGRQHAAIADIERLSDISLEFRHTAPNWLRQLAGNKRMRPFDRVVGMTIWRQASDADLACLSRFGDLQSLQISGPDITDAGLVHLHGLSELKHLGVWRTNVTAAGIASWKATRAGKAWPVHVTGVDELDRGSGQNAESALGGGGMPAARVAPNSPKSDSSF